MIDAIFLLALFFALIQNELPILAAAALVVCVCRGFAGWVAGRVKFKKLELAIVFCLAYWLLNYSWSTHS
ncbi:MAG: hypothetical protein ACRD19_03265, partial [Terriglobia bacterium]